MAILYYLFILGSVSVEHVDSGVAVVGPGLLVIAKSVWRTITVLSTLTLTYVTYTHTQFCFSGSVASLVLLPKVGFKILFYGFHTNNPSRSRHGLFFFTCFHILKTFFRSFNIFLKFSPGDELKRLNNILM